MNIIHRIRINIENRSMIGKRKQFLLKVSLTSVYLIIVLFFISAGELYSQNGKTNNDSDISKLKTTLSRSKLEKYLVGYWRFKYLKNSSGKIINKRNFNIDTLSVTEDIERPDFCFLDNKKYIILNKEKDTLDKGIWFYDDKERLLNLKYDKPRYNVPIEKLSPKLIKKLKDEKRLIKTYGTFIEIHHITKSELIVIEHEPHNEYELKYNLRVYVKNSQEKKQ